MSQSEMIKFRDCKDGDIVIALIYCHFWHDKTRISVFRVTHIPGDSRRFLLSNDARINGNSTDQMHGYTYSWEVTSAYYHCSVVRLPCAKAVSHVIKMINNRECIA